MAITTAYSVYQVDQDRKMIRRHASTHEPAPNQVRYTNDGDWGRYESIRWLGDTHELMIVWGADAEEDVCRRTRTSQVRQIDGPAIRDTNVRTS